MAIRVHLDLMLLRRKKSLTELAEAVGISLTNLSILKTGKARAIRFSTLEVLCQALQCQPGELLSWEDEPEPQGSVGAEAGGSRRK